MNSDVTNYKNGDVHTITLTNQQCGDATANPFTDDESSTKTIVEYSIADMKRAHIVSKCITILIRGQYCLCTTLLDTYPTFTHAHCGAAFVIVECCSIFRQTTFTGVSEQQAEC